LSALFAPLPVVPGGFACVSADVPSRFRSNSQARPGRNAMRHYTCHPMATIATLPVSDVVSRNALLWFWTTGPLLSAGAHIPVMRAWGFEPTAMGFVWVKLNPRASSAPFSERDLFFGPGLTTRKNAEYVVLGRRGRPERLARDVFEIIVAPRRESGRKPNEAIAWICSAAKAAKDGRFTATRLASLTRRRSRRRSLCSGSRPNDRAGRFPGLRAGGEGR
jgi:N6-adenosine-specific RNA methylase IME4